MITAPFNFVPLSEKVFFPDWAEKVSHDVPFEDSQSGVIDITLTAKSPIFVRNHSSDRDNSSKNFCHHDGKYYIPSTSVKGMIRNVLEIMSFGKIPIDNKIHKKIMSIRDMTNRKEMVGTANGCGFLKQNSKNEWYIEDYGKPRTIGYISKYDKTIRNSTINCDFETAEEKYNENTLYQRISVKSSIKDLYNRDKKKIGTKRVAEFSEALENAYLIFTGGIDNKKNEFVFADNDKESNVSVEESVVEKFKKVYFESDSVDGNYWKNNYNATIGIPIFYKKEKNKVTDIGLSQLFKLAYNNSIDDITKQFLEYTSVKEKKYIKMDLAEILFGTIQEEVTEEKSKENIALKGRVHFSHFKLEKEPIFHNEITVVLGSPNASFYPEYIKQNCGNNGKLAGEKYSTLMDSTAKISGWKRYPLHFNKINIKSVEVSDSSTTFIPLGNYSNDKFNEFEFRGKLRYHNLKKSELGAIVSALTFHNNHDSFYHNIGMAKSLGFGKIKIDIDSSKYIDELQSFEYEMDNWSEDKNKKAWLETEQIKELFTMAYKDLNIDVKLKYLLLDPENKINKFVDAKKAKHCLPKCSEMFDIGENYPKSLISKEEKIEKVKNEALKNEQLAKEKLFQTALNSNNTQILQNFIDKHPEHENLDEIKSKKEQIDNAKKANKHKEVDAKAKSAYDVLIKKNGNPKQYKKELDKFVKKWSEKKNHKGSEYILELIKKLK